MDRWRITHSFCLGRLEHRGEYALCLARGAENATAVVDVWWSRPLAHDGVLDPAVTVVQCSNVSARSWLEEHEHEYAIAEHLLRRAA